MRTTLLALLLTLLLLLPSMSLAHVTCPPVKRSQAVKRAYVKVHPCPATGKHTVSCPGFVLDHRYPICAGGKDTPANLAWQRYRPDSLDKDRLERELCRLKRPVCPHQGD